MLAVPYYEKALYELPVEKVTPENIIALANQVELENIGHRSSRPTLCVPHILSDESSCYYHGYVLAEMSVHQTRSHFFQKYKTIVDNPMIGKDLQEYYWKSGNSVPFLELVKGLTGKELTGDDWVASLEEDTETKVASEKKEYEAALQLGPKYKAGEEVDLKMTVNLVHGDLLISSSADNGLSAACNSFKSWIQTEFK
jgi:hypothetical protein